MASLKLLKRAPRRQDMKCPFLTLTMITDLVVATFLHFWGVYHVFFGCEKWYMFVGRVGRDVLRSHDFQGFDLDGLCFFHPTRMMSHKSFFSHHPIVDGRGMVSIRFTVYPLPKTNSVPMKINPNGSMYAVFTIIYWDLEVAGGFCLQIS